MRRINRGMISGAAAVTLLASSSLSAFAEDFKEPSYPAFTKDVTITWWSWTTNADNVIADFNKKYPNIKVVHPNIGPSAQEYPKLETALKAGSGAPDVVQIEYQYLPKFIETGGIKDISQYVNPFKDSFQAWTWQQVSRDNKVYAVPEDIGPMGLMYRKEIFDKYNLTIPKTWDEFASDAEKLHKAAPDMYMTYLPINSGGTFMGLLWQAGLQPFKETPDGWKIEINGPGEKKVANFWGDLIKKGYVKTASDASPEWQHELGKGLYASMVGAAWSPSYRIQPYVQPGTQHWQATDIPQWDSGKFVDGNSGGSTNAVTTQSQNPEAAALFAAWINTSQAGMTLSIKNNKEGGRGLFPANKSTLSFPDFSKPNSALDNQVSSTVFAKGAAAVDTSFQFSPWTDYIYSQLTVEFDKAAQGKETWDQALDTIQNNTVQFAKSMGFKVVANDAAAGNNAKEASATPQSSSSGSGGSGVSPGVTVFVIIVVVGAILFFIRRRRNS